MARSGGYVVLDTYHSSSSSSIYEVRRGGDGVLYCTCRGWVASKSIPRACKHCKSYVAGNPGTVYDLRAPSAAPAMTPLGSVPTRRKEAAIAAPVPTVAAGADWRKKLLDEGRRAVSRGVITPPAALTAFARELDLDLDDGVLVAKAARAPRLDLE